MFWIHIEVVLVDGERLGALSDAGHKLLHFKKGSGRLAALKDPHRNVGGSDTICEQEARGVRGFRLKRLMIINRDWEYSEGLLATSGATLSIVTSRLPKSTGSLAIFSGLMGKQKVQSIIEIKQN